LSGGYLSATAIISTRYFGAIGNEGRASAPSEKSSATQFTFYERSSNEGSWGEDHYIVTNTKLPESIEFRFAKYALGSAPTPTLLAGAHLELYKVSGEGDVTIPGTDQTGTLIRSWISENGNGESGGYRVEDLYSGIYCLIETRAPDGHAGLSGPIVFEVLAESGQVNVISSPYELTLGSGPGVDFPIYNHVTYELPETGGNGTTLYTIGGLLLSITALALLLYNNKRRRGAATYY
jgi:LPXTG-motif cell wall-anchored protein